MLRYETKVQVPFVMKLAKKKKKKKNQEKPKLRKIMSPAAKHT